MLIKQCERCREAFTIAYPSWEKRRFCSRACSYAYQQSDASSDFHERYKIQGDCWLWINTNHVRGGYGRVRHHGKTIPAHRLAYELFVGAIPEGLFVCHHCDTPSCVRPEHLFLGTPQDNMTDKLQKHRQARGLQLLNAKAMSIDDVRAIRLRLAAGEKQHLIAQAFNVNQSAISRISTGRRWGYLP